MSGQEIQNSKPQFSNLEDNELQRRLKKAAKILDISYFAWIPQKIWSYEHETNLELNVYRWDILDMKDREITFESPDLNKQITYEKFKFTSIGFAMDITKKIYLIGCAYNGVDTTMTRVLSIRETEEVLKIIESMRPKTRIQKIKERIQARFSKINFNKQKIIENK